MGTGSRARARARDAESMWTPRGFRAEQSTEARGVPSCAPLPRAIVAPLFLDVRRRRVEVLEVVDLKAAPAVLVPQSSLDKRVSDGGRVGDVSEALHDGHREKAVRQMFVRPHQADRVEPERDGGPVLADYFPGREDLRVIDQFVIEPGPHGRPT